MGRLNENISLISIGLKAIQEAPTRRNHVVFVADQGRNYYAQFRCDGGDSLVYAELVSNAFLAPQDRLDEGQVDHLLLQGWDFGGKTNFYRTWTAQDDPAREQVARELMDVFLEIYEVPAHAVLTSEVTLGEHPRPQVG